MSVSVGFVIEIEWASPSSSAVAAALELEEGEVWTRRDLRERIGELLAEGAFSTDGEREAAAEWLESVEDIWRRRGWGDEVACPVTLSE